MFAPYIYYMPQQPLDQQLQSQITALEFALKQAIDRNKPTANIFAINGKIKKLKKRLEEYNRYKWLAQ